MASVNITNLGSLTLPILDGDTFIISRDGIVLSKGSASSLKTYVLSDGSVTNVKLATDSVSTTKIQDLAITTGKYANSSITYAKIQNVTAGRILGRGSDAGNGVIQEIPVNITAAGGLTIPQVISTDIRSDNFVRDNAGVEYHGCVQIVSKLITVQGSQALVANAGDSLLGQGLGDNFEVLFTPRLNGSYVKITARVFAESGAAWNLVYNVHRNSSRLNNASSSTRVGLAMPTQTYGDAADTNSTPDMLHLATLDKTGTVAGETISYRIVVSSSQAQTIWINRCIGGSDSATFEAGVSEIIIEEYAQ